MKSFFLAFVGPYPLSRSSSDTRNIILTLFILPFKKYFIENLGNIVYIWIYEPTTTKPPTAFTYKRNLKMYTLTFNSAKNK